MYIHLDISMINDRLLKSLNQQNLPSAAEEEEIRLIMEDMEKIEEYLDRVAQQSDDLSERIREFVEEFNNSQPPQNSS